MPPHMRASRPKSLAQKKTFNMVTAVDLLQEKRANMCQYLLTYATDAALREQLTALREMPIDVFVAILLQNIKPKADRLGEVVDDMTKNLDLSPFLDEINKARAASKQKPQSVEEATADIKTLVLSYLECFLFLASSASLVL